jgi:hypothetical protein
VAHVRQGAPPAAASPAKATEPQAPGKVEEATLPPRNGGVGDSESSPSSSAAAEMPKAGDIPVEGRRLRLLDRITSLAKE